MKVVIKAEKEGEPTEYLELGDLYWRGEDTGEYDFPIGWKITLRISED